MVHPHVTEPLMLKTVIINGVELLRLNDQIRLRATGGVEVNSTHRQPCCFNDRCRGEPFARVRSGCLIDQRRRVHWAASTMDCATEYESMTGADLME